MDCPSCGHENPADATFCGECAGSLAVEVECPSCGRSNTAGQKFCHGCATPLARPAAAVPPERDPHAYTPKHLADKILQSKSALEGERKRVTVLFADLKSSMALSEGLDPEDWHTILDDFFRVLSEGVHRFEGTINQYTGDGIMALFGAPIAHEDHAQRACYAALHLREELRGFAREAKRKLGVSVSVRVGLHSGEVVVGRIGDDLRMDYTAQGHTVGLASRMQELASPDTCYLTGDTAELVRGYFELEDLGTFRVKGVRDEVPVFELKKAGDVRTRFDVSRARGLTRFVGRDADSEMLQTALAEAQAGNGQVVGIVADAGVGKSRLSFEFLESCRARGLRTLEGRAVAHGKNIPLLPILQAFRDYFDIDERDPAQSVREKIAGRMLLFDEDYREDLPLLFDFFGVPDPDHPTPEIDPEARQRRLFALLRRSVQRDVSQGTVVTLIEDLHWLDGASESWLAQWVDAHAGSQNLLVVNTRPEYRAEWMQVPWYRQLPLRPLGPEAIRELLADLIGNAETLDALAGAIHERTAGNPFFAEEVVRNLVESGHLQGERGAYRLVTPVDRLEVPESVQTLLAARIDKLPEEEKRLLQTAAVLGREFDEPILTAVCERDSAELAPMLQRLRAADLIYEEALYPVVEYAFKHPLTHEVALHSLLRERRSSIHEKAAKAIEASRLENLDEAAALIAHHWEEAGRSIEAARWHARAGEFIGSSDFAESQRHWQRVRELVRDSPDHPDAPELGAEACRTLLALSLRVALGVDDKATVFEEGIAWAQRTADPFHEGRMHQAMSVAEQLTGFAPEAALRHAREWERIASALPDPERSTTDRWPTFQLKLHTGDLASVHPDIERQIEATRGHPEWGLRDWKVSAHANALYCLGQSTTLQGALPEAADLFERAATIAREVGDNETHGWAAGGLAEVAYMGGDLAVGRAGAQRALETAERIGSAYLRVQTETMAGWMRVLDGEHEAAAEILEGVLEMIERTRQGVSNLAQAGAGLSEAYRLAGDPNRAIDVAERALATANEIGTRVFSIYASLALSRALRADGAGADRIAPVLSQARSVVDATGACNFIPQLELELAELARLRGDDDAVRAHLATADAQLREIGASRAFGS
ncbi:MAG: AAA family ATPase [Deltaproteobacteria bacterium]|nr:AAA family ATPase [Deltaproteobacteria bacterium]MBW2414712.1 AAA family ATPase [Deltaproteobacteria bacterium]